MRPQRGRLLQNSCNHDRLEYNRLNLSFFTLPELAPGGVLIYRVSVRPSVLFTGEALSCDRLLSSFKTHDTQEMEAKVVEAQSEVPHAMADALREGKLGVMDYYNLNNIKADTDMRDAISRTGADSNQLQPPSVK